MARGARSLTRLGHWVTMEQRPVGESATFRGSEMRRVLWYVGSFMVSVGVVSNSIIGLTVAEQPITVSLPGPGSSVVR